MDRPSLTDDLRGGLGVPMRPAVAGWALLLPGRAVDRPSLDLAL